MITLYVLIHGDMEGVGSGCRLMLIPGDMEGVGTWGHGGWCMLMLIHGDMEGVGSGGCRLMFVVIRHADVLYLQPVQYHQAFEIGNEY